MANRPADRTFSWWSTTTTWPTAWGIDLDDNLLHGLPRAGPGTVVTARRALLLRAGPIPLGPRLVTAPGGIANRNGATPQTRMGCRNESVPPSTWTESGLTPALPESSSSRQCACTGR